MVRTNQPKVSCSHNEELEGPRLGQRGAFCAGCGVSRPCPHPDVARKTRTHLGGLTVTDCEWCGEEMAPPIRPLDDIRLFRSAAR